MKKYVISDPDIMSGAPVIKGTRIPIAVILYRFKEGYTIEEIHALYPWVSLQKLKTSLNELAEKLATKDGQAVLQA